MYRSEYPRPELVRNKWLNLNGEWEFEFDFSKSGKDRGVLTQEKYSRVIEVPFCPESKLSGLEFLDFINACWYRRKVNIQKGTDRVILHFEASYYKTEVFFNGQSVGVHVGGYTPFAFDVTDKVVDGENTIVVYVEADTRDSAQPSGKQCQCYHSVGCSYTRSTGIWQTVWLEFVPQTYLKNVKMDSDIDNSLLNAFLTLEGKGEKKITLTAFFDGEKVGETTVKTTGNLVTAQLPVSKLKLWDVENPNLYDLVIKTESADGVDEVESYFAMRSIRMDEKGMRLNGKYVFQRLVLDQGYYRDGIYTAPCKEDMEKDILLSKRLGFNGARLHQKVYERYFLYYADKLGYLCYAEYASWGFDFTSDWGSPIFLREWMESMERDYNHPSIIGWIPMNETWENHYNKHQNDAMMELLYNESKRFDPYRPVIDTSGSKHVKTDIFDFHDYDQNLENFARRYTKFENGEIGYGWGGQKNVHKLPFFVSEYGGIGFGEGANAFSYGAVNNARDFVDRFVGLTDILLKNEDVCAICYTQLYDVEQEFNGIYDYDRVSKLSESEMDELKACLSQTAALEKLD